MSDREKRMRQELFSELACEPPERSTFVQRDMVCLVALDGILRVCAGRVMGVSFVAHILRMHFDNVSAHPPSFRIPAYMITDLEFASHVARENLSAVGAI